VTASTTAAPQAPAPRQRRLRTEIPGPASREYVLKPAARTDALDVFFPDGRPFHRMSFTPDASLDTHWCDPDTYRVSYTHQGPDAFSYSWDVKGPRKDLLLVSHLERIPE